MATHKRMPFGLPPIAARSLTVVLLLLVFVVVGSALDPRETTAAARRASPPAPIAQVPEPDETTGGRPLGALRGVSYRVLITSGAEGPFYTVSTLEGQVLASDLTQEQLWQSFPGLDVERLTADAGAEGVGEAAMYVDTDR